MRQHLDIKVQITSMPLTHTGQVLPGKADVLTAPNAFGNGKLQRACGGLQAAVCADSRNVQLDGAARAEIAVFQRDLDAGVLVLTVAVHGGVRS